MRRCPNPGCPFRIRHGFAAEFEDGIERCRSCAGPLLASEPEAARGFQLPTALLTRLAASAVALLGLVGFARAQVPGLERLREAGVDTSFATLALWPSLVCWIVSSLVVGLVFARKARRSRMIDMATLACTIVLLAAAGWACTQALSGVVPLGASELSKLFLAMFAGLPVLLAVALVNDRWGLGPGQSLVLAALLIHGLSANPTLWSDPLRGAIVIVALIAGAAVWMASPARASGRQESDGDLGLGLTVPTCGLLPVFVLGVAEFFRVAVTSGPNHLLLVALGVVEAPSATSSAALELAAVVALAMLFSWMLCRPARLLERWRRAFPKAEAAALARQARALFRRSLLRSALLVAVVHLLSRADLPAIAATILAAVILDGLRESKLRAAIGDVVSVEAPPDLIHAESLAHALTLERRVAAAVGYHHALYRSLGTWIPPRLLVSADDRARADELLDQLG